MRDLGAKKLPQALKKAQLGVKSYPNVVDFHAIAGFVLTEMGRYKQSIPHFVEASRLKPDDPQFAENLANAVMQTGRLDRALSYAEQKLLQFPGNKELQRVVDEIASKGNNWREIISFLTKKLETDPANAKNLMMRARSFKQIEFLHNATRDITKAYEIDPENEDIAFAKAIDLSENGDPDACAKILRRILELNTNNAQALLHLSSIAGRDQVDELFEKVEKVRPEKESDEEFLAFARAYLIKTRVGLSEAMPSFAQANALQQKTNHLRVSDVEAWFFKTCNAFPKGKSPTLADETDAPFPIFVVGQPRSGTTLMEMMLSSVPGVEGRGELLLGSDLSRPHVESGKPFDADAASAFASSFYQLMPPLPEQTTAFVDKMPHNYQRVGFLLSAFPKAKVINMLRDPRDVGLSKWIRRFPARGMRYSSDQEAIAFNANLYRKYMAHWDAIFRDRILTVSYEELVEDPEAQSKTVADFCDIEWSEKMLRPEENTKQVRTASMHQVRKKISTSSIGGWRQVADHIRPMLDGLDPDLWPEYNLRDRS